MKTYTFKVILEKDKWPDESDEKAIWRAYIPILPAAHAWGDTKQQALENLKNAVDLIIEDLIERGQTIPEEPRMYVQTSDEPLVTVTVNPNGN
ncbi:MAG: type II toxin-antitoxin system HicB family antitoxin [Candidatus Tectomicrobia bacterium]|nr:type II toxin-antitoxin system HicB family antitoxin [Candidatus Tectomicrobia bacterium]